MSRPSEKVIYRNPIARAAANSKSLRLAINAKCYECFGGSILDINTQRGILADIRGCTAPWCPIYPVRGGIGE